MHRYLESFIPNVLKLIDKLFVSDREGKEMYPFIENQELIESIKYLRVYPT